MKAVFASFSLLAVALLLDWHFKEFWYQSGADFIIYIQSHFRNSLLDLFFWLLSEGSIVIVFIVLLARFFDSPPQECFKSYTCAFVSIWITDVLKNCFSDPRPYWKYEAVEAVRCSSGWGNPSGHAVMVTSVASYQCWMLLKEYPRVNRFYVLFFGVVSFILIEFDRIYLGVHFYSQLILGTVISVTVVITFIHFDSHLNRLFANCSELKWVLLLQVPALVLASVSLIVFSYHNSNWSPEWSDMIRLKCKSEKFGFYCSTASLFTSSLGVLPSALICVFYYLQQKLIMNWWVDLPFQKRVLRLGVASISLLFMFLVRSFMLKFIDNATVAYIISLNYNYICSFVVLAGTLVFSQSFSLTSRSYRKPSSENSYELVEESTKT